MIFNGVGGQGGRGRAPEIADKPDQGCLPTSSRTPTKINSDWGIIRTHGIGATQLSIHVLKSLLESLKQITG